MEEIVIINCSKLYPALCFDMHGSPGFHNVYIALLVILSTIWLVNRLSKIIELYEMVRIIQEEGKIINIQSLGPYSNDLKKLIKPHISQIIRERCSISPTNVKKVQVMSIMEESTLNTRLIPNSSSSSSPDESYSLEVSFKVDSFVPYSVQLLWGVDYYATRDLLMKENKEEGANKYLRRMALGSSIAMHDQLKLRQEFDQNSRQGKNQSIELEYKSFKDFNKNLINSSRIFENMEIDNEEKERIDLNLPFDFSPSESMKSIAHVNPILYTTEIGNRRDFSGNSNNRDYFDYNTNISRRGVFNISSRIIILLEKINQRLRDNIIVDYISDTLNYTRWNSSLFGDNAIILGRAIKRVFESIFFYSIVSNDSSNNSNNSNNYLKLGGINLTKSSLLSSASATTELLLDTSSLDKLQSNQKSFKDKNEISYRKKESYSSINMEEETKNRILIDQLDPIYISEKKYYENGLSRNFSERIKLTQEYLSLCNLNSPYYDSQDEDKDQTKYFDQDKNRKNNEEENNDDEEDDDHYYFNGDYYEIQEKYNNEQVFWNNEILDFNNNNSLIKKGKVRVNEKRKKMARIPLLILISANMEIMDDEYILSNNIIAVNFDLIQDHYNIPYLMYKPRILKQVVSNLHGILIEPYDTYGLEDDEFDCLICMSNPKDVILLPCRHCISCESCLRSLRQDKCPLCRTKFSGFVVLPIKKS